MHCSVAAQSDDNNSLLDLYAYCTVHCLEAMQLDDKTSVHAVLITVHCSVVAV